GGGGQRARARDARRARPLPLSHGFTRSRDGTSGRRPIYKKSRPGTESLPRVAAAGGTSGARHLTRPALRRPATPRSAGRHPKTVSHELERFDRSLQTDARAKPARPDRRRLKEPAAREPSRRPPGGSEADRGGGSRGAARTRTSGARGGSRPRPAGAGSRRLAPRARRRVPRDPRDPRQHGSAARRL